MEHVLVVGSQEGSASLFSVGPKGVLRVPESPFGGIFRYYFGPPTFTPDGRVLVTTGEPAAHSGQPRALYAFAVRHDGTLTSLCGSPYALQGNDAIATAVSPTGQLLATVEYDGQELLSVYTLRLPRATCPGRAPFLLDNHFAVSRLAIGGNGTISLSLDVPGPGTVDVLATARKDNFGRTAKLRSARGRFVFARASNRFHGSTSIHLVARANKRGMLLLRHPAYRVTLRLWVTFTPTGGKPRSIGFFGLHPPAKPGPRCSHDCS